MRILAITYEFPPVGGGGGTVTRDVLTRLAQRGHTVDVVTMKLSGRVLQEEAISGMTVYRVFAARFDPNRCSPFSAALYLVTGWWQARQLVQEHHYDVLHATFILPSGVLAAFLKQRYGIPFVITAHGSDVPGHNPGLAYLFVVSQRLWAWVVTSARAVTANSSYLATLIREKAGRDVVVIPNGLTVAHFPQTTYGKTILVVGRLQKFKGVGQVIRAFAQSQARKEGYELAIIGDGPELFVLQQLAQELHVPVTFHGRLQRAELIGIYQQSSILVSASAFEALSSVVMEAMACGLAVIATEVGGAKEILAGAGTLIPTGSTRAITEALDHYCSNREELVSIGHAARKHIQQQHNIEHIAEQYEQVLS